MENLVKGELTSSGMSPPVHTEAVWCPVYDTQEVWGSGVFTFFQNPAGRGREYTNVATAGSLAWPKALSGRGIIVESNEPLPLRYQIRLMVGEILHHASYVVTERAEHYHLLETEPYFIPTIENFCPEIRWNGNPHDPDKQWIRITLGTWLVKEVQ